MDLKAWWRCRRPAALSHLAYCIVRGVAMTVKVHEVDPPAETDNAIVCGWHGKSLLYANRYRNRGWWVIISHSNDGEIQAHIFKRLGYQIIRGSTGRGGVRAAIEAIRALKAGGTMAMTPDGPRGPSGVLQSGVILMAMKSGARLIPVGISARPRILFRSWDRYMVPFPFARGIMVYGEPITIPADADADTQEALRLQFETAIHRLEAEADRRLGNKVLAVD